jgi:hypothetical protein
MRELEQALAVTENMRKALETEVIRAREQRLLIRTLDSKKLFDYAQLRSEFNFTLATLEGELAKRLSEATAALGLTAVTLDQLRSRVPAWAKRLGDAFAQVRALAAALQELDTLNRLLGERALTCVRTYVAALTAQPNAYDRRGAARTAQTLSTSSRVV